MKHLTALETERLKLEAAKYVDSLSYIGLCDICPRDEHWFHANSEDILYKMQRKTAIDTITNRLIKAAKNSKPT